MQASAGNLKKVQLELGGKGANIVFDDANLVAAVNGSAWAIFHNQGQACIAGSRLMLHEKIADAFLDKFIALARSIRLGNPLDAATEMGPLTSAQHRDRVLSYVDVAREQGGELLSGGKAPDEASLAQRLLCRADGRAGARPIATASRRKRCSARSSPCSPSTDDDEALQIANGTDYGLGSGLWTAQPAARAPLRARAARRHGVDQQLQAGQSGLAVRRRRARAAMAARWASTRCASTRRSRACGSMSMRRSPPWYAR